MIFLAFFYLHLSQSVVEYICNGTTTTTHYIMTVLNHILKRLAEEAIPSYLLTEVSEAARELANLKEAIEEVETRFNSARSMTARHRILREWKNLETQQSDLAIDIAEVLNLSDETLRNLIK